MAFGEDGVTGLQFCPEKTRRCDPENDAEGRGGKSCLETYAEVLISDQPLLKLWIWDGRKGFVSGGAWIRYSG